MVIRRYSTFFDMHLHRESSIDSSLPSTLGRASIATICDHQPDCRRNTSSESANLHRSCFFTHRRLPGGLLLRLSRADRHRVTLNEEHEQYESRILGDKNRCVLPSVAFLVSFIRGHDQPRMLAMYREYAFLSGSSTVPNSSLRRPHITLQRMY